MWDFLIISWFFYTFAPEKKRKNLPVFGGVI